MAYSTEITPIQPISKAGLTNVHNVRLWWPNSNPPLIRGDIVPEVNPFQPLVKVPSPGVGGFLEGPGGQAPSFAPGGPDDPYPESAESAGMQAEQQIISVGSPSISAAGGYGANLPYEPNPNPSGLRHIPGQPGYTPGPVPGKFQPRSGDPMNPTMSPTMNPSMRLPVPPSPVPMPGPPIAQQPLSGAKPKGIRTMPMSEKHSPPSDPPKPPGQWIIVDAGFGMPPAYGFVEVREVETGVDTGLEGSSKKDAPTPGYSSTKKAGEKGHYVPVQISNPMDPDAPVWAWIPEIDATFGIRHKDKDEKAEPIKS